VLARGPALALVDDFARRNTPGTRHPARWQDVQDLLAAGIDVISAISVGHLDSLADVVAKITGTAPRQTVPDSVVRAAAEVELVDVAPDALRDRLARGHLRPADQVEAALGGSFQIGNLSALREIALLWLTSTLASGRGHLPGGGEPGSGQTRRRDRWPRSPPTTSAGIRWPGSCRASGEVPRRKSGASCAATPSADDPAPAPGPEHRQPEHRY
jgi:two-component system sensor histidine kinase KdpD